MTMAMRRMPMRRGLTARLTARLPALRSQLSAGALAAHLAIVVGVGVRHITGRVVVALDLVRRDKTGRHVVVAHLPWSTVVVQYTPGVHVASTCGVHVARSRTKWLVTVASTHDSPSKNSTCSPTLNLSAAARRA